MALIKCIKCGCTTSTLSHECAYCGCSTIGQKQYIIAQSKMTYDIQLISKLKNQEKWEKIVALVNRGCVLEAHTEAAKILGDNSKTALIIAQIIKSKELPEDYILELFPDQAI